MKFVVVYKVADVAAPLSPAVAARDYYYGRPGNAGSMPVEYTLMGWLVLPPAIGEQVRLLRVCRNGVMTPGVFTSTEVIKIPGEGEFHTRNSIYRYEEIAVEPT
ncbi:hypothetical protein ESB00_08405 [Oleiharenicola lentus]|uniref:Uncharacterized protein n=1 Tax=Oleiharenicola lentus TaxID=2508720 RepID=A0A4Q1C9Z5_9BACT|nr:hypothetical protein [Oleiharenicola lentus]RXK55887.1 hypothetical protein ESB00_08405 [Oleiharenicola lentus]